MRMIIQRVNLVRLTADGRPGETSEKALLAMVGLKDGDDDDKIFDYMLDKLSNLRVFEDENGKMNLSAAQVGASLYLVSNFTLYGDLRHGRRPSYSAAMPPARAKEVFERFVERARAGEIPVRSGVFGADMQIETVLDGPVTLLLDSDRVF